MRSLGEISAIIERTFLAALAVSHLGSSPRATRLDGMSHRFRKGYELGYLAGLLGAIQAIDPLADVEDLRGKIHEARRRRVRMPQILDVQRGGGAAMKTYYAVCNVNGPISVNLGEHPAASLAVGTFLEGHKRDWIDGMRTDAEDDLGISCADMTETEFAVVLRQEGCQEVADLEPIINTHAGTVAHLADGWMLWSLDDEHGTAP